MMDWNELYFGRQATIKRFLESDISQSDLNCTLGWACFQQDHDTVRILLDHNADPNSIIWPSKRHQGYHRKFAPLLKAIKLDDVALVELLLERHARMDYVADNPLRSQGAARWLTL
jgi:ankyrin repeat protein